MQCQQLFVDTFNPITYQQCNRKVVKTCELCLKPSCEKCMFLVCEICKKKPLTGSSIARRGLAKKKGGVGKKTTGITKRKFFPNLQSKRVVIGGKIKKVVVCTKCIKAGKLTLPSRKPAVSNN